MHAYQCLTVRFISILRNNFIIQECFAATECIWILLLNRHTVMTSACTVRAPLNASFQCLPHESRNVLFLLNDQHHQTRNCPKYSSLSLSLSLSVCVCVCVCVSDCNYQKDWIHYISVALFHKTIFLNSSLISILITSYKLETVRNITLVSSTISLYYYVDKTKNILRRNP